MMNKFTILLLAICLISMSCTKKNNIILTDEQLVMEIIKTSSLEKSRQLDLSDSLQSRFYFGQLEQAGITPELYPQLFKTLRETQKKHKTSPPEPYVDFESDEQSASEPRPIWSYSGLGEDVDSPGNNYMSSAFSSVPNGTYYSLLTLAMYDENGTPLDTVVTVQEYSNGEYTTIDAYGDTPAVNDSVHSIYTFYYIDNNNTPSGPHTLYMYNVDDPQSIDVTNPVDKDGSGTIVVCINRTHGDCDYDTLNSQISQGNVMFPLSGSITYSDTIDLNGSGKPQTGISNISLARNGGCTVPMSDAASFFDYTSISNSGKTLNWNLTPVDFYNSCLSHLYYDDVTFNMFLGVTITGRFIGATITNADGATCNDLSVKCIPQMQVVSGCVATGSMVLMADGSSKPIESLKVREKVRANEENDILTIRHTTKGFESIPMYDIKDDKGHSLMVSEKHAIPTANRGIRVVHELRVGDILYTTEGTSKISSISKVMYDDVVWNLDVGLPSDRVELTDMNTTFYANNILIGDFKMQNTNWDTYRIKESTILERLPKEWHTDYRNYLKQKKGK